MIIRTALVRTVPRIRCLQLRYHVHNNNPRFNDIVVDDSGGETSHGSSKFDILGNKYKATHVCSSCSNSQQVEIVKLSFHRGCVVVKCDDCSHYDLFSDKLGYFKTDNYVKELSCFDNTEYAGNFIKVVEGNVTQITQIDSKKKRKVASSRMADFWEGSAWDDSKELKV